MTITSTHNQRLREIRKLRMRRRERDRAGRFVAEGEDLLAAADAAGWEPLERFCTAGSGLPGIAVEPSLLASASGLASGTRTLAVYEERWAERPAGPLCVYLHGLHDPGNVGTILRSALAFGVDSVAFGPGSADPFSPKAVRASMGAVFAVPVARAVAVPVARAVAVPAARAVAVPEARAVAVPEARASSGDPLPGRTIALVAGAGTPLPKLDLRGERELTLLIGSEREGLPAEIVAAAGEVVQIPIAIHSLNAAMAATVALYEVTRMARA